MTGTTRKIAARIQRFGKEEEDNDDTGNALRRERIRSSEEGHMCPACIARTAVMVAGAGSTGGILAVCIGKFRTFSERIVSVCFREQRRNEMATSKERDKEHGKEHLAMNTPPIVSQQEWEAARQQLLVKEKALTRSRDALAAERRRMPWVAVEKKYEFDGPKGKVSLLDLFEGRRQLIVYRAFFEPGVFGWPEHACRGCSLGADQVSHLAHLNARDTTLAWASRAPQADIARLKKRMGWEMPWYTMTDSFDKDFGVDQWHGHNVFFRDGERVFRTYFINNRGDEAMGTIWSYLDLTPLGRQETWEDSPEGYPQDSAVQVVELARQLRGRGHASPEVGRYNYRPSRSRLPKARRRGES